MFLEEKTKQESEFNEVNEQQRENEKERDEMLLITIRFDHNFYGVCMLS